MSLDGLLMVRGTDVTLETPSETGGDGSPTWTTVDTVKALIQGSAGQQDGMHWEAGSSIIIAYRSDVTPRMQIGVGTRKLRIVATPVPDMWRKHLTIAVEEVV